LGGACSPGKQAQAGDLSRQEQASLEELLERFHIYLFSDLERDRVESLGFAFIESNEEIDHLARRAERCLLVADADCSTVSI
jgi:hypothetical protein